MVYNTTVTLYKARKFPYTTPFQDCLSRDRSVYRCFNVQLLSGGRHYLRFTLCVTSAGSLDIAVSTETG